MKNEKKKKDPFSFVCSIGEMEDNIQKNCPLYLTSLFVLLLEYADDSVCVSVCVCVNVHVSWLTECSRDISLAMQQQLCQPQSQFYVQLHMVSGHAS